MRAPRGWEMGHRACLLLDDSGKDPQNRITTIAGYAASDEQWKAFETEVETWFTEVNVKILHAKDLHDTDGEFAGWSRLKKQAFVARLCQAMSHHLQLGVSISTVKETYATRADESDRRKPTPYTYCFNVIIDWLLRDIRVGRAANTEGVAFILECGHENNGEAEQCFYAVRARYKLENVLHPISFVPKDRCRAIQMADLIAFYSRRHGVAMERARLEECSDVPFEEMMELLARSVPYSLLGRDRFLGSAAKALPPHSLKAVSEPTGGADGANQGGLSL